MAAFGEMKFTRSELEVPADTGPLTTDPESEKMNGSAQVSTGASMYKQVL